MFQVACMYPLQKNAHHVMMLFGHIMEKIAGYNYTSFYTVGAVQLINSFITSVVLFGSSDLFKHLHLESYLSIFVPSWQILWQRYFVFML